MWVAGKGARESGEHIQPYRALCAVGWGKWSAEELILVLGLKENNK